MRRGVLARPGRRGDWNRDRGIVSGLSLHPYSCEPGWDFERTPAVGGMAATIICTKISPDRTAVGYRPADSLATKITLDAVGAVVGAFGVLWLARPRPAQAPSDQVIAAGADQPG
jgi:hypothetical protein